VYGHGPDCEAMAALLLAISREPYTSAGSRYILYIHGGDSQNAPLSAQIWDASTGAVQLEPPTDPSSVPNPRLSRSGRACSDKMESRAPSWP